MPASRPPLSQRLNNLRGDLLRMDTLKSYRKKIDDTNSEHERIAAQLEDSRRELQFRSTLTALEKTEVDTLARVENNAVKLLVSEAKLIEEATRHTRAAKAEAKQILEERIMRRRTEDAARETRRHRSSHFESKAAWDEAVVSVGALKSAPSEEDVKRVKAAFEKKAILDAMFPATV
mmetsp:Transcript_49291/g.91677  ORF Transcript_49291/g.91677 Transcript_49291/m.91677 type:complete len:177 (+) Transcript_49291:31-561(+)